MSRDGKQTRLDWTYNEQCSAVKFGRMTKCQRELLLDQAETYRNEMEKKQKENLTKFDFNSTGELSDSNSNQSSSPLAADCKCDSLYDSY